MHTIFNNTNININNFKIITYKKNDVIFNEGDSCDSIGLVIYGNITITTYTYNEKEYEIINIQDDGIFGQNIIFSNQKYLGTGITTKETKVVFISKKELLSLFTNQTFAANYLSLISKITLNIQKKVKLLTQKEIRDKIMFLLYENIKETNSNTFYYDTKEKLALYLNITRPSLSRELINMKNEGIIEYDLRSITLLKK